MTFLDALFKVAVAVGWSLLIVWVAEIVWCFVTFFREYANFPEGVEVKGVSSHNNNETHKLPEGN